MSVSTDWRARVLDDGGSRGSWLAARELILGASDLKMYANPASVEKYVAAKIRPKSFFGNEETASGHRWEPMILAYLGVSENKALVRSPDNPRIACTPDGITEEGLFTLAEAKTRHGVIKPMPDAAEWRQLAAQFYCFPEAERLLFGTVTLVRGEHDEWVERRDAYSRLEVMRDHPKIIAATELIIPIAEQVLAALDAAREAMEVTAF